MFFHWPGQVPSGRHFHHPVSALDFYPTLANLAEAEIPAAKQLDGLDIWADLKAGRNPRLGGPIFAMRHREGFSEVGMRQDQWKIRREVNGGWKLFNIENDIQEKRDLKARNPQLLENMVSEVRRWSESHVAPRWFDSTAVRDGWNSSNMPNYDRTFQLAD